MEQYYRCQCLRVEGIVKPHKEKAEDVINLVKECFAETDVDIPGTVLDRAHRMGPIYKDESDQKIQWIIVKFNNFRYWSMFYKNKIKKKQGKRVPMDRITIIFWKNKCSNQTYENGEHCLYIFRHKLQTKSCE